MQRVRAKQLESICPDWNTTLIRLEHLWLSRNFMPKWQLWRSSISGGLPVWWGERRKWSDLSDVARDVISFFLHIHIGASRLQKNYSYFLCGFAVHRSNKQTAWTAQNFHFCKRKRPKSKPAGHFMGKRAASSSCSVQPQQPVVRCWNSPVWTAFCTPPPLAMASARHREASSQTCARFVLMNACCSNREHVPVSRLLFF